MFSSRGESAKEERIKFHSTRFPLGLFRTFRWKKTDDLKRILIVSEAIHFVLRSESCNAVFQVIKLNSRMFSVHYSIALNPLHTPKDGYSNFQMNSRLVRMILIGFQSILWADLCPNICVITHHHRFLFTSVYYNGHTCLHLSSQMSSPTRALCGRYFGWVQTKDGKTLFTLCYGSGATHNVHSSWWKVHSWKTSSTISVFLRMLSFHHSSTDIRMYLSSEWNLPFGILSCSRQMANLCIMYPRLDCSPLTPLRTALASNDFTLATFHVECDWKCDKMQTNYCVHYSSASRWHSHRIGLLVEMFDLNPNSSWVLATWLWMHNTSESQQGQNSRRASSSMFSPLGAKHQSFTMIHLFHREYTGISNNKGILFPFDSFYFQCTICCFAQYFDTIVRIIRRWNSTDLLNSRCHRPEMWSILNGHICAHLRTRARVI